MLSFNVDNYFSDGYNLTGSLKYQQKNLLTYQRITSQQVISNEYLRAKSTVWSIYLVIIARLISLTPLPSHFSFFLPVTLPYLAFRADIFFTIIQTDFSIFINCSYLQSGGKMFWMYLILFYGIIDAVSDKSAIN